MLSTKIGTDPDVFEVQVPYSNISTSYTNCFVIRNGGESLVVDTGSPTEEGAAYLRSALAELGIDAAQTPYFLTHLHMDHAGLIDLVAGPEAPVYLGANEYRSAHPSNSAGFSAAACRRLAAEGVARDEIAMEASMLRNTAFLGSAEHPYTLVSEGDTLFVGSTALQVVDTAGHTPGHLALFEPSSQTLFCGDHILFGLSPSVGLFPQGEDAYQTYFDNLVKVLEMPVRRLLVGHGRCLPDHRARIEWLISHHEERLEEAARIICKQKDRTGYEIIKDLTWGVPFDRWADIPLPQRCCIAAEGIGVLDHLWAKGLVFPSKGNDGIRRWRTSG